MNFEKIIQHRKHLHKNPELSGKEINTSNYIKQLLKKLFPGNEIHFVAGNGLLITLNGSKKGKHVLFRCELDALPIQEINNFKHKSTTDSVSHKCGHDGHMAILIAVAQHFKDNLIHKGTLSLLFQPAEENGEGAIAVINDKTFQANCKADYIFALHNVPGYRKHTILCKENIFTPSVISVKVKFSGKTAHAAEPENGINPSYAIARLITTAKELENNNPKSKVYSVLTPVYTNIGTEDYGISAGYGEIGFTLRTWKNSTMVNLREKFMSLVINIAIDHELKYELDWFQEFSSINNHKKAVKTIRDASKAIKLNYIPKKTAFPWGEDFGLFTEKIPGAMFGLGAGKKTPALHNPDYDFPDELIETGSKMFISIFNTIQHNE